MNNVRISSLENYEHFKTVCSFFRFEDEYPGWTGEEKYGIITEVDEVVLLNEYPVIMRALSPYIILGEQFAKIRNESINNDRRHQRNQENTESQFALDEETAYHHDELLCPDFTDDFINTDLVRGALSCLTEVQRRRIEQHYFQNMSVYSISKSEGGNVNPKTVWESIQGALKKMKIFIS